MQKNFITCIVILMLSISGYGQKKDKKNSPAFCTFATKMLDYCDHDFREIIKTELDSGWTDDSDFIADYTSKYLWDTTMQTGIQRSNFEGWNYSITVLETKNIEEFKNVYTKYNQWLKDCKAVQFSGLDSMSTHKVSGFPEQIYIRKKDNVDKSPSYPSSIRIEAFQFGTEYSMYIKIYPERR